MIADMVRLTFAIATIIFAGSNILRLIGFRQRGDFAFFERMAIAYGLGMGAISLEMLLFYFLKIPYNIGIIAGPWLLLFILNSFLSGPAVAGQAENLAPSHKESDLFIKFLCFGISMETLYAFFRALVKPMESFDSVAMYAIKSKMVYAAGAIRYDLFNDLLKHFPHPDYPLNIPLAETFVYIFLGSLNDQLVKIIFPLFFLAVIILIYYAIKRVASRKVALLFTFFLATIPQFNNYATNGYLDLPLAYYVFLSFILLLRWKENGTDMRLAAVSALACAFAGWTKNEGLMYCIINVFLLTMIIVSVRKRPAGSKAALVFVTYLCVIIAISAPWASIKNRFGFVNDEVSLKELKPCTIICHYERLWPIVYEFQKQVLGPKKWNIFWILFIAALLLRAKRAFSGPNRMTLLAIILALGGYCLIYMITLRDVHWQAATTASRFLIHVVPLAVLWLAGSYQEEIKS